VKLLAPFPFLRITEPLISIVEVTTSELVVILVNDGEPWLNVLISDIFMTVEVG
jgi:hypothetical protein